MSPPVSAVFLLLSTATISAAQPCQPRWSPLPGGVSGGKWQPFVSALAVFDDGAGPALYVGGRFTRAGGIPAPSLARWDGQAWSAVPGSPDGQDDEVRALLVFDDGSGLALFVGGEFAAAGGQAIDCIARFDGQQWSPVGTGLRADGFGQSAVLALTVADRGQGPRLIAGGRFDLAGVVELGGIAEWDGAAWVSLQDPSCCYWAWLGGGIDPTFAGLAPDRNAQAAGILGVGIFGGFDGDSHNLALRDADGWTLADDDVYESLGHASYMTCAMARSIDPPDVYLGGGIEPEGYAYVAGVVRHHGGSWAALPPIGGQHGEVYALADHDDGSGVALYAGGDFTVAGGAVASGVARWDGSDWSPLGAGIEPHENEEAFALASFDDGSGPALYAGGAFSEAGGVPVLNIARWGCPSCPADCDASGDLDLFDFLCFVNRYNTQDPAADCTADGGFDFFDFVCFINQFNAGC